MIFSMLGKITFWSRSLYNVISNPVKVDVAQLSEGEAIAKNEKAVSGLLRFCDHSGDQSDPELSAHFGLGALGATGKVRRAMSLMQG
jgi:hypothetical protein